ncbi:MAG: Holliday junction resolvase RuvX [Actinomycetota bacterium]
MLRGVRLAMDVGTVRIGVAKCDPDGMLAVPLETIAAGDRAIARAMEIIKDEKPIVVYVGNPISLKGEATASTQAAIDFAQTLVAQVSRSVETSNVSVRMIDERLSTVSAQRGLHEAGKTHKSSREVIDQAAAIVILEHAIESEKRQGEFVGREVVLTGE